MDATVEHLTALLAGDKEQRSTALSELSALCARAGTVPVVGRTPDQESALALAAACVPKLIAVLCEDVSRVDAKEAREVILVLCNLMRLDPLAVAKEYVQDSRSITLHTTKGSALDELFGKSAEDLIRDDMLLAACNVLPLGIMMAQGSMRVIGAAGLDADLDFWGPLFEVQPEFHTRAPTHERNRQLVILALDLLRSPQDVSQMELAGIWELMFWSTSGRPVLFAEAVKAGLWELALETLRRIPAAEQVCWRTAEGILASGISITLRNICEHPPGLDPTKQLIETGTVDLMVASLEAYELLGASDAVHEGNPCTLVHFLMMLQAFDITTPEAEPIYTKLQQIPSALRFLHDVNIYHVKGDLNHSHHRKFLMVHT